MTKASLNRSIINIFVNNTIKIALKNNKMIEQVKLKLIFSFFIVDIDLISFYLGLKLE